MPNLGVVANVLACNLEVNEFELQSRNYVQFWTNNLGKPYLKKNSSDTI